MRPSASYVAVVTFPFGSVTVSGAPHAGSSSVTVVCEDADPDPSGSGVVLVTFVTGPPLAGVYAVVEVRPSASVTDVARPSASYTVRSVATYTGLPELYFFACSVRVTRPLVGVAPNDCPSNEYRSSETTSAGREMSPQQPTDSTSSRLTAPMMFLLVLLTR